MTAEIYTTISYISAGLCVLFFLLAVILFFKLKIRSVIGDLSGSTARKAVKALKEHNASDTGRKTTSSTGGGKVVKAEADRTHNTQKPDSGDKAIVQRKRNVNKGGETSPEIKKDAKKIQIARTESDEDDNTTLLGSIGSETFEETETSLLNMQTENDFDSDNAETSVLTVDYLTGESDESDETSETTVLNSAGYNADEDGGGETSVLTSDCLPDESDELNETTVLTTADYNGDKDDDGETTMLSVFNGVEIEKFSDYDEEYAETTLLSVRKSDEWAETIKIIDEITYVSLNELIN